MVSVIVPVFNAANFIHRSVESIINQSYNDLEIILINDGSTDNTIELLNAYAEKDNRIRVIDQDNIGVAATRNVGLKNAKGEFILFIDSDDWLELDAIERLIEKMDNDTDIVFCSFDNANVPAEVIINESLKIEKWNREKQQLEFMRHQQMTGMLWNKLIRNCIIKDVKFDETVGYGEDAQFLWAILKNSRQMVVSNEVLYHHVLEDSSISHLSFSEKKYTAIPMWEAINVEVEQNYFYLNQLAKERLLAQSIFSLYEINKSNYNNKDNIKKLKLIIRNNIVYLLKAKTISNKMKIYGLVVML